MRRSRISIPLIALFGLLVGLTPALAVDPPGTVPLTDTSVSNLALSPGRATWIAGSVTGNPVRKRSVTLSGGVLALGPTSQLGLAKSSRSFFEGNLEGLTPTGASGIRTLWGEVTRYGCYENGIDCYILGTRGHIAKGTTEIWALNGADPITLSGTRALLFPGRLLDLDSGTVTDLGKRYGPFFEDGYDDVAALWGNYLYLVRPDGSIWRKNLSTATKATLVAPVTASKPGYVHGVVIHVWGDWVSWSRQYWKSGQLVAAECGMRNARTQAPIIALAQCASQLTSAGAVVQDKSTKAWSLHRYDGVTVALPVPTTSSAVTIDGDVLGWIDHGNAQLAPLPDAPSHPPRSLGNPIAAKSFKPSIHSWALDLVTSASLTSCTVTIAKAGTTYRTLPCTSSVLSSGEVMARWDGKATNGHLVPAGTYSWTVHAANGDGSLLRSDGVAKPTAGLVTVA